MNVISKNLTIEDELWRVLGFGAAGSIGGTLGSSSDAMVIDTASVPELRALHGKPQPAKHHPEIDTWVHVRMAVVQARRLTNEPAVHFATLLHDLGKGTTPDE